ncbi:TonB-dependent receptor plug domain-containing protein [Testudinibacter sp. TR-2022]|uniref:TonB-dependent receptor plug domain-containing protein n=1 Tax=Testudinibacter sp. TR-2022 TaxID=2585029 RepID=UPI0011181A38|nr:TonB-dependent receptor [Testudinibacter sp. TR-2022]TNH06100.1 TonB-dependent receptor [Pasteurellaceae bacterium Phil11]TNH22278.1 TonB-dependent receptor [Testudinibacter sp. TR-2022]TNH24503.1 TonB-dependent receptor [Testudinibacter sp. TR-2022]
MKKNLITTALLATLPSLAIAEQETTTLQPITVYSAYAAPVNQDQTASSVTVLTEQDFANRDATYVSDALKTVPSMAWSASGGRGTLSNFYLRGADANHTAVIIDGVKVNPVTGYGFDFGGLSLSNIDRIEVLRGEQSALWGSDAMGGVIYITTKSGLYKDKPFNVDFDFGTGSHGTVSGSATLSGYNNGFYYALHGDSQRTRGISAYSADSFHYRSENGSSITTGGAKERDKFHRDNASLRLGYDAEDKGVEVLAAHSSQNVRFDNSYAGETAFDDYTRTRDTTLKLSGYLGNDQQLFKQQASVSHIKTDSDTFSAWASRYDAKKLNTNYQLDINFDREGAVKQAVSMLAEYQQAKYDSSSYSTEKSLIEKSIATEYRLFSEQDHSLSISGRFNDSSEYKNAFTGRIAGAYRLSPNIKAHASLGTAIQNPTMTEYYGWNSRYLANPELKPERSRGGDIGFLLESSDKRHSVDVTYFARNVDHLISSEVVDLITYTSRAVNVDGTSKIRGVEIAYNGKLTDVLNAYANYTYLRAKDSKQMELVRRPKHTANAGLAYQITQQFSTNVNISYVGKRIDSYYDENTYTSSRVKMPSYTLVNLGADYQLSKNLTVYTHLNNLFNKKYEHTVGYGQDGRNIYVGLKGSF